MAYHTEIQDLSNITGFTPKLVEDINPHPQTITQPSRGNWSKDVCLEIAKRMPFPEELRSSESQRTMIIQFLRFYVTGNIEDTYDVTDVILAVASMTFKKDATTSTDLIWPDHFYGTEKLNFNMTPKSITSPIKSSGKNETKEAGSSMAQIIQINDKDIKVLGSNLALQAASSTIPPVQLRLEEDINQLAAKVRPLLISYTGNAAKDFYANCEKILGRSPATDAPTREALELYRLLNFTALTMLRATTKTSAQMITGFLKRQYKNNIATFTSPSIGEQFVPPCEACIQKVCLHITKTRPQISSMFSKIVIMSTEDNRDIKAYLDASVLTHTSWNGLGILQMLFEICQFFGKSWVEIYHITLISSTAHSWRAIINFLKKYQSIGNPDMTVPWSRVIDDAYFMKMGPRDHPTLAALLVKSLEYAQGEDGGMDQAAWVQRHHKIVDRCAIGAEHVLGVLNQENVIVTAGSKESHTLAKIINARTTTVKVNDTPQTSENRYDDI